MSLSQFGVDVPAVIAKRRTLIDETAGIDRGDLRALTVELYDRLEELTAGIDDRDERGPREGLRREPVGLGRSAGDGGDGLAGVGGHGDSFPARGCG